MREVRFVLSGKAISHTLERDSFMANASPFVICPTLLITPTRKASKLGAAELLTGACLANKQGRALPYNFPTLAFARYGYSFWRMM